MAGHYQERIDSSLIDTRAIFHEIKRDVAEIECIVDNIENNDLETIQSSLVNLRYKINVLAEKLY